MDVVNESRVQELLDRGNAPTDPNVFSICGRGSALQGGLNAFGNEMERSLPGHRDRRSCMVGQHEHRSMERWIIAPPALPGFVRPGPSHRPKHVAADDPCSNIVETTSSEIIVNARCPALVPKHALEGASREHPIVQRHAANTKRVLKVLTRTSTVAVNGNPKRVDSELSHERDPNLRVPVVWQERNDKCIACILQAFSWPTFVKRAERP